MQSCSTRSKVTFSGGRAGGGARAAVKKTGSTRAIIADGIEDGERQRQIVGEDARACPGVGPTARQLGPLTVSSAMRRGPAREG